MYRGLVIAFVVALRHRVVDRQQQLLREFIILFVTSEPQLVQQFQLAFQQFFVIVQLRAEIRQRQLSAQLCARSAGGVHRLFFESVLR